MKGAVVFTPAAVFDYLSGRDGLGPVADAAMARASDKLLGMYDVIGKLGAGSLTMVYARFRSTAVSADA
jgi:hypothetical protein